ncbi:uncharacterized protein V6R79_017438 [Siganus canaliculatus]
MKSHSGACTQTLHHPTVKSDLWKVTTASVFLIINGEESVGVISQSSHKERHVKPTAGSGVFIHVAVEWSCLQHLQDELYQTDEGQILSIQVLHGNVQNHTLLAEEQEEIVRAGAVKMRLQPPQTRFSYNRMLMCRVVRRCRAAAKHTINQRQTYGRRRIYLRCGFMKSSGEMHRDADKLNDMEIEVVRW